MTALRAGAGRHPDGWSVKVPASGPERAAQLTVALASGKADVLTGRFIGIEDDPDEMVAKAQLTQKEELYLLRMKSL